MSTALVFASISRHSSRLLFKNASQSIAKRSLSTAMINLSPSSSTSTSNIINSNYSKPYINNKPLFSSPLQQSIRTTASKEIADANHIEDALNDPTATPGESVLLTSRDTVEGRVIVEELGIVAGSSARSRNILIDLLTRIKGFFGGALTPYSEMFSEATTEATKQAMEEAEKVGATSIIRVRYQNACTETKLTGVSVYVLCYGTAVRCVDKVPQQPPQLSTTTTTTTTTTPSLPSVSTTTTAIPNFDPSNIVAQPIFVAPVSVQEALLQNPPLLKQQIDIQWQQLQQLLHLQELQKKLLQQTTAATATTATTATTTTTVTDASTVPVSSIPINAQSIAKEKASSH